MIQDIRFSLRQLRKNPTFAVLAILTLALGIGANTAMFTVTDSVLIRPLAYANANRLVQLVGKTSENMSWPNYRDVSEQVRGFEATAAYAPDVAIVRTADSGQTVFAPKITSGLFDLLGVRPALGRGFSAGDCVSGGPPVVVLSDSIWRQQYNADRGMIGRQILIGKTSHTVIGVMPAGFGYPATGTDVDTIIWLPLQPTQQMQKERGGGFLNVIGRMAEGVSLDRLQSELDGAARHIREMDPEGSKELQLRAGLLQDALTGPARPVLLALSAALGLVLLIACANVANLQLARCLARQQELAMRLAMGARRSRLVRQLLVEGALLSILGSAAGMALVWLILTGIRKLPPDSFPRIEEIHVRLSVLGAVAIAAVLSTLLSSLIPAWWASRSDPQAALKGSALAVVGGRSRLSGWLVAGEVSLATLLLLSSGLMFRTLYNLEHKFLGFETAHVTTFMATPPDSRGFFGTAEETTESHAPSTATASAAAAYAPLLERLRQLPGVRGAALASTRPLQDINMNASFQIAGKPAEQYAHEHVQIRAMSGAYAQVLGTRVVRGRAIADEDTAAALRIAVVNQEFVRRYLPGQDPLGQQVSLGSPKNGQVGPFTVVGVLADAVQHSLTRQVEPEMDVSYQQVPAGSFYDQILVNSLTNFVVVASGNSVQEPVIRRAFKEAGAGFALDNFEALDQSVENASFNQRLGLYLVGSFAGLAVVMVMAGLYGVLSQLVGQRRREIGIRMALGADRPAILLLIARRSCILIGAGISVGLIAGLLTGRLMNSFLYDVKPTDVLTYAGVVVALFLVGVVATWLPARRAASIEPNIALRAE